MQLFELLPGKNCKGKCLKISRVAVRWEDGYNISAIVVFDVTRERADTKTTGIKLFARNADTIRKMIQEMALLYQVKEKMTVCVPETEQEGELWSYFSKENC